MHRIHDVVSRCLHSRICLAFHILLILLSGGLIVSALVDLNTTQTTPYLIVELILTSCLMIDIILYVILKGRRAFLSWRFYFDAFVAGISVFVVVTALLRENVAWVLGLNVFLLRQVLIITRMISFIGNARRMQRDNGIRLGIAAPRDEAAHNPLLSPTPPLPSELLSRNTEPPPVSVADPSQPARKSLPPLAAPMIAPSVFTPSIPPKPQSMPIASKTRLTSAAETASYPPFTWSAGIPLKVLSPSLLSGEPEISGGNAAAIGSPPG